MSEKNKFENFSLDGKIILEWKKLVGEAWTVLIWLRIRTGGDLF
jgi:hypothetical protein